MELRGHVGAALAAYAPLAFVALRAGSVRLALAGAAVTVALASLPDLDLRVPRLRHRGHVHTVWFGAVVGAACAAGFAAGGDRVLDLSTTDLAAFGFAVGATTVLAHLAVDALTPMGVAPISPVVRRRFSLDVVPSADPVANRRLLVAGLVATVATFVLGGAVGAVG